MQDYPPRRTVSINISSKHPPARQEETMRVSSELNPPPRPPKQEKLRGKILFHLGSRTDKFQDNERKGEKHTIIKYGNWQTSRPSNPPPDYPHPDLSLITFSTSHHLSGRILPTLYAHNQTQHCLPRPPFSLVIQSSPPKVPPKPSWLKPHTPNPKPVPLVHISLSKATNECESGAHLRNVTSPFSESSFSSCSSENAMPGKTLCYESDEFKESIDTAAEDAFNSLSEDMLNTYNEMLLWKKRLLQEDLADIEENFVQIGKKLDTIATVPKVEKYKSHCKDIEKIAALDFCLSTRLSRVEEEIDELRDDHDKWDKKRKKEKLMDQLEEAKLLKIFIDKRTVKLVQVIGDNIDDLTAKQFEKSVSAKNKIIVEVKEVEEKLKNFFDIS